MPMASIREQVTTSLQKWVANPVMRMVPTQTLLETTGRTRRTPLGGRMAGNQFWLVSEFGDRHSGVRTAGTNLLTVRIDLDD
jgi:F420H(2)-dependent quinone reductase